MNKELLDKINAAVEADQIAFKQAAANLNLTLNEGAISGRRQGNFKGYSDAIGEIERLKGENEKMRRVLEAVRMSANRAGWNNHDPVKELEFIEKIATEELKPNSNE